MYFSKGDFNLSISFYFYISLEFPLLIKNIFCTSRFFIYSNKVPTLLLASFFSDCFHEVWPVASGNRITLTPGLSLTPS